MSITVGSGWVNRNISQERFAKIRQAPSFAAAVYMGPLDCLRDYFCDGNKKKAMTALYHLIHGKEAIDRLLHDALGVTDPQELRCLNEKIIVLYVAAVRGYVELSTLVNEQHVGAFPSPADWPWQTLKEVDHTLKIILDTKEDFAYRFRFTVNEHSFDGNIQTANDAVNNYLENLYAVAELDAQNNSVAGQFIQYLAMVRNYFSEWGGGEVFDREPIGANPLIGSVDEPDTPDLSIASPPPRHFTENVYLVPSARVASSTQISGLTPVNLLPETGEPDGVVAVAGTGDLHNITLLELPQGHSPKEPDRSTSQPVSVVDQAVDDPVRNVSGAARASMMEVNETPLYEQVKNYTRDGVNRVAVSLEQAANSVRPSLEKLQRGMSKISEREMPGQTILVTTGDDSVAHKVDLSPIPVRPAQRSGPVVNPSGDDPVAIAGGLKPVSLMQIMGNTLTRLVERSPRDGAKKNISKPADFGKKESERNNRKSLKVSDVETLQQSIDTRSTSERYAVYESVDDDPREAPIISLSTQSVNRDTQAPGESAAQNNSIKYGPVWLRAPEQELTPSGRVAKNFFSGASKYGPGYPVTMPIQNKPDKPADVGLKVRKKELTPSEHVAKHFLTTVSKSGAGNAVEKHFPIGLADEVIDLTWDIPGPTELPSVTTNLKRAVVENARFAQNSINLAGKELRDSPEFAAFRHSANTFASAALRARGALNSRVQDSEAFKSVTKGGRAFLNSLAAAINTKATPDVPDSARPADTGNKKDQAGS